MKLPKIIRDTLKTPSGKWSRKSLTAFVSFVNALLICWFIFCAPIFLPSYKLPSEAITVFFGFLTLGGGTLGMTVWQKYKLGKNDPDSESTP